MITTSHPGRIGGLDQLRAWPARRWVVAALGAGIFAVAAGAPTDVIPNPVFHRELPVQWWSYPTLVVTALLGGLVMATYVRSQVESAAAGPTAGGGLLSALAIGCPVCNKLVVLALGTSGAVTIWAPLQPVLGVGGASRVGAAHQARRGTLVHVTRPA